jgi:hypothetical protein
VINVAGKVTGEVSMAVPTAPTTRPMFLSILKNFGVGATHRCMSVLITTNFKITKSNTYLSNIPYQYIECHAGMHPILSSDFHHWCNAAPELLFGVIGRVEEDPLSTSYIFYQQVVAILFRMSVL